MQRFSYKTVIPTIHLNFKNANPFDTQQQQPFGETCSRSENVLRVIYAAQKGVLLTSVIKLADLLMVFHRHVDDTKANSTKNMIENPFLT